MARIARLAPAGGRAAFLGVVLLLALTVQSAAQSYPRVHVIDLAQRSDRASVAPGDVFVVTIHVKIAQRRERLDDLILGSFENCEIISNETVRTAAPDGTDFIERLTVQALAPGDASIGPAYIDALDPTIGKPMRFSSNAIRVRVTGAAPLGFGVQDLADKARRLLLAVAITIGFAAAIFVLGVMFVRRRKRSGAPVTLPPAAVAPPAVVSGPRDRLLRAAAAFASDRSTPALEALRSVLFELAGVAPGATLVDALRALGERDRPLRVALLAAERAAFGPAGERRIAGDELIAAVAAYTGTQPATATTWTL